MSHIEFEEILSNVKAISPNHSKLISLLFEEENVYTNKGRLNKSSLSRIMNLKPKEIEDLFYDCQKEMTR